MTAVLTYDAISCAGIETVLISPFVCKFAMFGWSDHIRTTPERDIVVKDVVENTAHDAVCGKMTVPENLLITTSPDAAGAPPGGDGLLEAIMQILDDWEDVWCVFVVSSSGPHWGFYRADDGVPSDRYSHDMKNPTAQIALSVTLADTMFDASLDDLEYSVFVTDATQKHSVGYSEARYDYLVANGSSSSE